MTETARPARNAERSSPSSGATGRTGAREPRARVERGERAYTDGPDAALLISDLGMELFGWERDVLDAWSARDGSDRPAYTTCGLSVPRQNGKNAIIEAYEVYQLVACGSHVLHTAHRVKTAKKSFGRLVRYFTDGRHPEVSALVEKIRYTNGEESILLSNGASVEFSARSRAGARGFDDIQAVVFDEAQDLTDEQLEAVLFTLAASSTGDRQMIFAGTPPDPTSPGTVFGRRRRAALSGDPPARTCWHEWGVESLPPEGATFADLLDAVYLTNPSMGLTLDEEWTETEYDSSDLDGFARERLGWWSPDRGEGPAPAIDPEVWRRTAIPAIATRYQGLSALGVKFSVDGASWALAGCKARRDRSRYAFELVEVGDVSHGTRPLAEAIAMRRDTISVVLVDGASGADALCANLAEMGMPRGYVARMGAADVVAAAQGFVDGLVDGTVSHATEGQGLLDECAAQATRREIGRKGGWGIDGSIELEACAQAVYGARTTRRDPRRRQRIL